MWQMATAAGLWVAAIVMIGETIVCVFGKGGVKWQSGKGGKTVGLISREVIVRVIMVFVLFGVQALVLLTS